MAVSRLVLLGLASVTILAVGCGKGEEGTAASTTSAGSSVPPAPEKGTQTYTNDTSKGDVGENGMPGGGPSGK